MRYVSSQMIKAKIIVASATGVPQSYYRRFAEYITQQGYEVVSFDYRGIAASAPPQLKGFKMSYLDWGYLDFTAAIDYYAEDNIAFFILAHSYSG